MKKLLMLLLCSSILFAQDDRLDDLPFDDEPLQEGDKNYFAIAGGYTFNVGLINVDQMNNFFNKLVPNPEDQNFEELSSPIFLNGGGGFTGIPFWKNIRVGFEAWAGSSETNELINDQNVNLTSRGDFNIALTAIHADYGVVLTDGVALLAGLKFGWSGINMVYTFSDNSYNWNELGPNQDYKMVEVDKSWLFIAPQVSLDWAVTEFLMISLGASYQLNFDNPLQDDFNKGWRVNRIAALDNVPDDLNLNHLNFRFGIYLGLFNY